MAGLIPLNLRSNNLMRTSSFDDFYSMLDDFFSDSHLSQGRSLVRDTFKIDIEDREDAYLIEAELPGIKKEEVDISVEDDNLCISVNRSEETKNEGKNYIHRERRSASMNRRVRLAGANLNEIKARLEDGVLTVSIPKEVKQETVRKIAID